MEKESRLIRVDTSVWAAYFNGAMCPETACLDRVLAEETRAIVLLPIILTEVLQGFWTESGFRSALAWLRKVPILEPSIETHIAAARMFRRLRSRGVTVRGAVDCVIARPCIESGAALLTLDRDFRLIARHEPLMLAVS